MKNVDFENDDENALFASFPDAIFILSAGGTEEAEALYTAFRGSMPGVAALLKGRGLIAA